MINIIFTIVGESFSQWVKQKIEERNLKVQVDKGLMMEVDDEINAHFQQSTAISNVIIYLFNLFCNWCVPFYKYCIHFANIFCFLFIKSRGIAAQMCKIGTKRRRTHAQVEADKEEAVIKKQ